VVSRVGSRVETHFDISNVKAAKGAEKQLHNDLEWQLS